MRIIIFFYVKIVLLKHVKPAKTKAKSSQVKPLEIFGNVKSSQSHVTGLSRPGRVTWLLYELNAEP
jgi:hypothetical protein